MATRRVVIEDAYLVPNKPNSTVPIMEYGLAKHFCAKLELITYGGANHHNAAVSLYKNCGINQYQEYCPDKTEKNGVRNHLTIWANDWFPYIKSLEFCMNVLGPINLGPDTTAKSKKRKEDEDVPAAVASSNDVPVKESNGNLLKLIFVNSFMLFVIYLS